MPRRNANMPDDEPVQLNFKKPSEIEHRFQVVDIIDNDDPDVVVTKLEVVGGDEEGRTILNRVSLDATWKGFFNTRLFLKAVGEPYKGAIVMDSDNWIGRQFYATVVHTQANNGKVYANIAEYNFVLVVEQATETQVASSAPVEQDPAEQQSGDPAQQKAWDE